MRISTKGRYALRMMIEFALNEGNPSKINQVPKTKIYPKSTLNK